MERRVPVMLKELEELVEEYPSDSFSILDVGCGVGGFLHGALILLSKKHQEVEFKTTGIDISREMIDYAKTKLQYTGIELVCDSITNQRLKFKNVVIPPTVLELSVSMRASNEVQFEFFSPDKQHSEGRLVFAKSTTC